MLTSSSGTKIMSLMGMMMLTNMTRMQYQFGESKWNPYWVIVLMSSSGTNYVPNKHKGVDQYGSFALPPDLMLYQSHLESLVNQNEILIELLC